MLLLRPYFLKVKNIFKNSSFSVESFLRLILAGGLSAMIPYFLYYGMHWVLSKANAEPSLSILPPSLFLGMILGFLQVILLIPALFLSLGNFYLSEDLELILASPVKAVRIFLGRFFAVTLGASWMPFIFIFPVLLAISESLHAGSLVLLKCALILIPFFVIPSGLAVAAATLMTYLMPAHRARYVSHLLFLTIILAIIFIAQSIDFSWTDQKGSKELLKVLKFFEIGQNPWLPSTWAAKAIEVCLERSTLLSPHTLLLYAVMLSSISIGFLSILLLHPVAYDNARARNHKSTFAFRGLADKLSSFLSFLPDQSRAFFKKEYKVIARDIGQTVQLLVLCILALLYLYNIRMFAVLDSVPGSMAAWWRTFLFLGNLCMGAFLTTSICTRLVFPSVSLEGKSFWIIQTAPIEIRSVLQAKLLSWFIPVAFISLIFFTTGAIAIGGKSDTIFISGLLSLILCYGIVGLAVGLGAYFARFDWEHPSQLSASLGSMLFMLCAISLVFLNMLPAWFLLAGKEYYAPALGLSLHQAVAVLVFCSIAINLLFVRASLRLGEAKLHRLKKQ